MGVTETEKLYKRISNGDVDFQGEYHISTSLPSWWSGPRRELHPYRITISNGRLFMVVSIDGVGSAEELSDLLNRFDLDEAYSRYSNQGSTIQRLEELVRRMAATPV
jgi:hypothetical protein